MIHLKKKYENERIKEGVFGAHMKINLTNDGPVNIQLNVEDIKQKSKK